MFFIRPNGTVLELLDCGQGAMVSHELALLWQSIERISVKWGSVVPE